MRSFIRTYSWELLLIVLVVLAVIWSSGLSPYFLQPANLLNSAKFFVIFALMAFGLFPVVVHGEIDISVASTLAVGSVLFGQLSVAGVPLYLALPIVLVITGLLGAINGVLVAVAGLPSLAVTLGTLGAYRGLAYLIAGDGGITGISEDYLMLGSTWVWRLPASVALALIVAIAFWILMSATPFGRRSYAIGNSAEASRMAGVGVARTKIVGFVLAGVMSGLGGLVWVAQYQSARGDNADGTILFVLTAVVLGGASIQGGSGRAQGVFLALLLLGTIQTGMKLANIPGTSQTLVVGMLLIGSIGIPSASQLLRGWLRSRKKESTNPSRGEPSSIAPQTTP